MSNILKWRGCIAVLLGAFLLCGFSDITLTAIQTAILEKDYGKAKDLASEYVAERHPKSLLNEARYFLGISRLHTSEYLRAREEFQGLLANKPDRKLYNRTLLAIVDSYYLAGDYEDALSELKKIERKKTLSDFQSLILFKQAKVYLKLTQWDEARRYLRKILTDFPDSPESHFAKQLLEERQYFAVQLGSFMKRDNALKLIDELKDLGEYAYIVETEDKTGRVFYRVRVGKFSHLDKAEYLKERLSRLGYPTRIYP